MDLKTAHARLLAAQSDKSTKRSEQLRSTKLPSSMNEVMVADILDLALSKSSCSPLKTAEPSGIKR